MSDIIPVDFGKAERDTVRKFSRLIGVIDAYEEMVLKDPIKHIKIAGNVIMALRKQREDALAAWRDRTPMITEGAEIVAPSSLDTIVVAKHDWDALQLMREILESQP